jgi:nitrite reductase/ring-hydroxylating ferredoxin subunit
MTRWVDVGALTELRFAPGAPVQVDGHWIALFRQGDEVLAVDNACPHASAPLCDGSVLDGKIVCYLHLWEFDLRTGACDVGPMWSVRTYPARVVDGRVQLEWSGPPAV